MAKIDIDLLNEENLQIEVVDIPEGIKMHIIGTIDMQQPNIILTPYFSDIHNRILSSKIKLLEIDITGLEFMNSSGIGTLIKWFVKMPLLQDDDRYKIKILFNTNIKWQKKGLTPLINLAPDQIELIEN